MDGDSASCLEITTTQNCAQFNKMNHCDIDSADSEAVSDHPQPRDCNDPIGIVASGIENIRVTSEMDTDVAEAAPPSGCGRTKLRERMLDRVANSDAHFKHQQRGEPDLTYQEKLAISLDLLDQKPSIFLSRFGKHLAEEDLEYFDDMKGDYVIDFHIKEIRKLHDDKKCQNKIRNRRFEAMKKLVAEGEYFSDDEMKSRDPLLYEQMIGQYLSDDEINAQIDKSDLRFSTILMQHLRVVQNNELYSLQKLKEESQTEEEENSDSEEEDMEDEDSENPKTKIADEEKQMLREEFLNCMKQRFLGGEDPDFNYREVDENVEFDSLDILGQDEEEQYFDQEEPETVMIQESSSTSGDFLDSNIEVTNNAEIASKIDL